MPRAVSFVLKGDGSDLLDGEIPRRVQENALFRELWMVVAQRLG